MTKPFKLDWDQRCPPFRNNRDFQLYNHKIHSIMKYLQLYVSLLSFMAFSNIAAQPAKQLKITVENNITGAPVTLGIPFPKGELASVTICAFWMPKAGKSLAKQRR